MKKISPKYSRALKIGVFVFCCAVWLSTCGELIGDMSFNYYRKFNLAKRAIEQAGCIESISYGLHRDITLEDFRFFIQTKSGWSMGLWFYESMDVQQICESPKGILLVAPTRGWQVYTINNLSERLKGSDVQLRNIGDILCNLDELVPIFEANYYGDEIPIAEKLGGKFHDYLIFESLPLHKSSIPVNRLKPVELKGSKIDKDGLRLSGFEFDTVTLNSIGEITEKRKGRARFFNEDLGDGVTLEMVEIPGGEFLMGTSEAEAEQVVEDSHFKEKDYLERELQDEMPKHAVTVQGFFIGMFEVTQAQWRAVARMPKVNRELNSDPSDFKDDDLPVTHVSWEDAVEFCERLSKATGRQYRLPSEAEWEYACRAGTTTTFHFGETITPDFANYYGYSPYGSARWGIDRGEPIPVGSLGVANSFGLYDMHGNVWEMCLGIQYGKYEGVKQWGANDISTDRVKRGGSWNYPVLTLRAASRSRAWINVKSHDTGFRVVALPRSR